MPLTQLDQGTAAALYVVVMIAVALLTVEVKSWIRTHRIQLLAAASSLQDAEVRHLAEQAVRWAETAPDLKGVSGLAQRDVAVGMLVKSLGLAPPMAELAIDAAYHGLLLAGQIAPPPGAAAPAPLALPSVSPREGTTR